VWPCPPLIVFFSFVPKQQKKKKKKKKKSLHHTLGHRNGEIGLDDGLAVRGDNGVLGRGKIVPGSVLGAALRDSRVLAQLLDSEDHFAFHLCALLHECVSGEKKFKFLAGK
jgi:hypothetical protein